MEDFTEKRHQDFLAWPPNRANCPEFEAALDRLIDLAPLPWKATMRNIFVARVAKGDPNATAWSFRSSGVVEVNYGFTRAAMIYATIFCQFYDALATIWLDVDLTMEDEGILQMIIDEIDQSALEPILVADSSRASWLGEEGVFAAHPALLDLPSRTAVDSYHEAVCAVEEFVLSHEISHHMLGHTEVSFRKSSDVARLVDGWISRVDAQGVYLDLNESQKQEIQADVAAFLLTCGELGGRCDRILLYRSISGAMLALTSLAHITEMWSSSNSEDSHPDFVTRYGIIAGLIVELSKDMPRGEIGDHPRGFLLQFQGFISMVLQAWLYRKGEEVQEPKFLNFFAWLMDESARLENEIADA
ncbi:hypothetical protein ACFYYM_32155 [Streptomyces erythrochromogenes]|uniref:hypothetical protein n=1 Tax=Streptomyces erythrochromogenes TaxID=285574 RepID=UPI00368A59DA